jgi:hypothetical protein
MWGFERLLSGPNKGGYSHTNLVRGQPALCRHMKRLKIKGTGNKPASSSTISPTSVRVVLPVSAPPGVVSREAASDTMFQDIQQRQQQPQQAEGVSQSLAQQLCSRNASLPIQARQQQFGGDDLFDEDTLLSVLSSVLESPSKNKNGSPEINPHDGDCVCFEGMQFFFVEDDGKPGPQGVASRRMSIEFSRGLPGAGTRRLSLVGAQGGGILSNGMGNLVPTGQPTAWKRASRRFSLARNVSNGNNGYVFKQIVGA